MILAWAVRSLLAAVFVVAGAAKLAAPGATAASVAGLLSVLGMAAPGELARLVAAVLPWLELSVGAAVLTPWLWRGGIVLCAALLAGFSLLIAAAWTAGATGDCGCFGPGSATHPAWTLARNAVLLLAAGWFIVRTDGCRPEHGDRSRAAG